MLVTLLLLKVLTLIIAIRFGAKIAYTSFSNKNTVILHASEVWAFASSTAIFAVLQGWIK